MTHHRKPTRPDDRIININSKKKRKAAEQNLGDKPTPGVGFTSHGF